MIEALNKLVRLSELRKGIAERALAAAQALVEEARRMRNERIDQLRELEVEQAALAERLRSPVLGAPQTRGVLAAVLESFEGDQRRLEDARQAILDADLEIEEAKERVAELRKELMRTISTLEKRKHLRAPLIERKLHKVDLSDEREAEDRRYGNMGGWTQL